MEMKAILADPGYVHATVWLSIIGGLKQEVAIPFATMLTEAEIEADTALMAALDDTLHFMGYRRTKVFGIKAEGEANTPRVAGKGTVFAVKKA